MSILTNEIVLKTIEGVTFGVETPSRIINALTEDTSGEIAEEAAIASLQSLMTFAELAGIAVKKLPVVSGVVDVYAFQEHIKDAIGESQKNGGKVSDATWMSLGADTIGVLTAVSTAGIALAATIGGVAIAPVAVPVLAAGLIASATLTTAGIMQSPGDTTIQDFWTDFANSIADAVEEASGAFGDFFGGRWGKVCWTVWREGLKGQKRLSRQALKLWAT